MADGPNVVGSASVKVTADTTGLKTGLDSAQRDVRGFSATAQKEAASVEQSVAQSARKSVNSLRGVIGTVTGAIGIFTAFFAIGRRVSDSLQTVSEKADQLKNAFNFAEPIARFNELDEEVQKFERRLSAIDAAPIVARILESEAAFMSLLQGQGLVQGLEAQLEELERRRQSANDQRNARELRERERQAKAFADALEREVQRALESAIDKAAASRRSTFSSALSLETAFDSLLANQDGFIR
jgi:predicted secreted protein